MKKVIILMLTILSMIVVAQKTATFVTVDGIMNTVTQNSEGVFDKIETINTGHMLVTVSSNMVFVNEEDGDRHEYEILEAYGKETSDNYTQIDKFRCNDDNGVECILTFSAVNRNLVFSIMYSNIIYMIQIKTL